MSNEMIALLLVGVMVVAVYYSGGGQIIPPVPTTTTQTQTTTTGMPDGMKSVAYFCDNAVCVRDELSWKEKFENWGYHVDAKYYGYWTLSEVQNYDVIATGIQPVTVSSSVLQDANQMYNIGILEMGKRPTNGLAMGYIGSIACYSTGYKTVSISTAHPVTNGLAVGDYFSVNKAATVSDIRCFADSHDGAGLVNRQYYDNQPVVVAVDSSGRYVWSGMFQTSVDYGTPGWQSELILHNALDWLSS